MSSSAVSSSNNIGNNWIVRNDPIKRIPLAISILSITIAGLIGGGVLAIKTPWIATTCIVAASIVGSVALFMAIFKLNLAGNGSSVASSASSSSSSSPSSHFSNHPSSRAQQGNHHSNTIHVANSNAFSSASVHALSSAQAMPQQRNILAFYTDKDRNVKAAGNNPPFSLEDFHDKWTDEDLENGDSYIPWVFPIALASLYNPNAPILDGETIKQLRYNANAINNMRYSFNRMMRFYGFDINCQPGEKITITKAENFDERSKVWLSSANKHYMHITRILTSLRLFDLEEESEAFYKALKAIYQKEHASKTGRKRIGHQTIEIWRNASGAKKK